MSKYSVLFVDDEQNILNALKRMLRSYRKYWNMYFTLSGEEALEIAERENITIIVSDLKLGKMDGIALLKKVRTLYPSTIRIIFSGHYNSADSKELTGLIHQLIVKPSSPDELKRIIDNTCYIQNVLKNKDVKSHLSTLNSLPSLPTTYTDLMSLASTDDFSLRAAGEIISEDSSMSTNVLKMVNSSYYGIRRTIKSPVDAVTYLGFSTIQGTLLTSQMVQSFPFDKETAKYLSKIMKHNTESSLIAKELAKYEKLSTELTSSVIITSMLHDIGKIVLLAINTVAYKKILTIVENSEEELIELENRILGVTHSQVGAYLLGMWGIDREIVEGIAYHNNPERYPVTENSPLPYVVAASLLQERVSIDDIERQFGNYFNECGLKESIPHWKKIADSVLDKE